MCMPAMGLLDAVEWGKVVTVAVLTAINLLNYVDRWTLAGILPELQNTTRNGFHGQTVSDAMGGLLQTAFIVSYMLLSPLFGYLGDRYTRKYIISGGIAVWSLFTAAGSFSVNFWMLLGTRLFVGVGEASYATIAPTMIADLYPAEKRLRPLTVFYLGIPIGSALGYVVGSGISRLVYVQFGQESSWRWALRVTPVVGIVLAVLVIVLVREPPRGKTDGHRSSHGVRGKTGFWAYVEDVRYCLGVKTFTLSTLGFTSVAFVTGALAQWAPAFVYRASYTVNPHHPYSDTTAAMVFGVITVLAGVSGTVSGSLLSMYLGRFTRKADAFVCSLGMLAATPALYLSITVVQYKQLYVAWLLVFIAEFFLCLNWAPVAAMLLYSIVPARRSTAEAVQILFSHLFGDAISPTIVGAISDAIYAQLKPYHTELVGKAISMEYALFVSVIVCALGGAAFLASSMTVEKDRRAVELYTRAVNAKIQRGDRDDEDSTSSGDFDERRHLLGEALREASVT